MKQRGFTLIELAMVLVVAAVVAGIVVARVDGWSSRQELHTSARTLGNMIRTWRERAMEEERPFHLVLDLVEGSYRIEDGHSVAPSAKGKLGAGRRFGKVHLGEIELKSPVRVILDPRGVIPEFQIGIENTEKEKVFLRLLPLVNEVRYEAPSE